MAKLPITSCVYLCNSADSTTATKLRALHSGPDAYFSVYTRGPPGKICSLRTRDTGAAHDTTRVIHPLPRELRGTYLYERPPRHAHFVVREFSISLSLDATPFESGRTSFQGNPTDAPPPFTLMPTMRCKLRAGYFTSHVISAPARM